MMNELKPERWSVGAIAIALVVSMLGRFFEMVSPTRG